MPTSTSFLLVITFLIVSLFLRPFLRRLYIPFNGVLVLVGLIGSEVVAHLGGNIDIRWDHFHDVVFYGLLPILIFKATLFLNFRVLRQVWAPVVILGGPYVLLSALLIAGVLYASIHHPEFPWSSAMICGALLASTSPAAIILMLRRLALPQRLLTLLGGESLLNSVTAITLFDALITLAAQPEPITLTSSLLQFLRLTVVGALAGFAVGGVALWLQRQAEGFQEHGVVTLLACFTSVYCAVWWNGSAVLGVFICGLLLKAQARSEPDEFVEKLWSFLVYLAVALLFLLMGMSITLHMVTSQWLAMRLGLTAVLFARIAGVYLLLPSLCRLSRQICVRKRDYPLIMWSGLRSVGTLALVFSLPESIMGWWTIQSVAYAVVLFNIFLQAPAMEYFLRARGDIELEP